MATRGLISGYGPESPLLQLQGFVEDMLSFYLWRSDLNKT